MIGINFSNFRKENFTYPNKKRQLHMSQVKRPDVQMTRVVTLAWHCGLELRRMRFKKRKLDYNYIQIFFNYQTVCVGQRWRGCCVMITVLGSGLGLSCSSYDWTGGILKPGNVGSGRSLASSSLFDILYVLFYIFSGFYQFFFY